MIGALRRLFTRTEITTLTQRRRERRFSCFVPVVCTSGTDTESAMIVDVAQGGLRMLIRQKVKPGTILQLHYNKPEEGVAQQSVAAKVMWSRKSGAFNEVGVLCQEGQLFWVPALLKALTASIPDYSEVRRTVRFNAGMTAALSVHFGPSYVSAFINGHVADLSLGGAAFCGPVKAQVGTVVQVMIQPGKGRKVTVKGRVVRQSRRPDGRTLHGIRFEEIDENTKAELSHILFDLRDREAGRPVPSTTGRLPDVPAGT